RGGIHPKGELYKYQLEKKFQPEKTIKISGTVKNSITNENVEAIVLVSDPILGKINYLAHTKNEFGTFETLLNAKKEYMFHVYADGYSHVYKLFNEEDTKEDQYIEFLIFPEVSVILNMFDKEELWQLDGQITVKTKNGKDVNCTEQFNYKGQRQLTLPVGVDYTISVTAKDYLENELDLALSNIILFDEFIRDIELVPVKRDIEVYVTDISTNNPLNASVELFDKRERKFSPKIVQGIIGLYQITLREGEAFDVEVRGPRGFAFKHTEINLDVDRNLSRLLVELQPLMRKVPIQLDNINFESNSADLMEYSFKELDRVVVLLTENPDIHVEIMAHTDDVGSDKFNNVLADKRAKSVVEYLVISGIRSDRLVAKGYGETTPIVANDSDKNRALNRRVEMKILDENDSDFMIEERIIEE
ncbi:MAG: OmpA family protein, partial [Prolixibacteraceae bacterium]|nr:OmpA family protein [Prolixibacteraceae bacterium]